MKIVSKRGKNVKEVDIELNIDDLEEDTLPFLPKDEPNQQEFEFYTEDWVVQGATKLGAVASYDPSTRVYTVTFSGQLVARVTEYAAQTYGSLLIEQLRDTIERIKMEAL